jgi:hypothetical protein
MGKPADVSVGFVYPAGGSDNDIGVYKQPQPNTSNQPESIISKSGNPLTEFNISVGGVSKGNVKGENPEGKGEMRGYGAATKGRKISGKMG